MQWRIRAQATADSIAWPGASTMCVLPSRRGSPGQRTRFSCCDHPCPAGGSCMARRTPSSCCGLMQQQARGEYDMCEDNANQREKALRAVVTAALAAHPGAQAVNVAPKVQGDHAVAEITLLEHGAMTTVSAALG